MSRAAVGHRLITLLTLLACAATSACTIGKAKGTEPLEVWAYYYPWFTSGDWSRHPYTNTPAHGLYGTDDPQMAKLHVAEAADHGIDGFMVSWWGADSPWDKHLRDGLLAASNLNRVRFAIFYESPKLDSLDGKRDLQFDFASDQLKQQCITDLRYLRERYFGHPRYWRIEEKPVVGFYLTRNFKNFSLETLQEIEQAAGVDIYAIGDEVFYGEQANPSTATNPPGVLDAYTAYNLHQDQRIRDDDTANSFFQREAKPVYQAWLKEAVVMPGVLPSYQDFRDHKSIAGSGNDFTRLMLAASGWANQNRPGKPRVVFITSYNEWWEGTTIETAKEYGDQYLHAIQSIKHSSAEVGSE